MDGEVYEAGSITSVELANSSTPLLLSSQAQRSLGIMLNMAEDTVYSKTLDKELEMVTLNGLPALRLYPGDETLDGIAMMMSTEESTAEPMQEEVTTNETDSNETSAVDDDDSNLTEEESQGEQGHLPFHELKKKILTKNQKKMLHESLGDMEKEDCAMWSVLQGDVKRPRRMLPKGCRSFVMEVFAGAATLSCIAASMGLAVAPPIDIEYDARYDLLQPKNRDMLWDTIEEEDPFLLSLSPLCGPMVPVAEAQYGTQ